MKKGFTIVELLVSMAIFIVLATLLVGAFTTISRIRMQAGNMKENQTKMRMANELISRLSRQAEEVSVLDSGKTLDLSFNILGIDPAAPNDSNRHTLPRYARFKLVPDPDGVNLKLNYYEESDCVTANADGTCAELPNWNNIQPVDLLSGVSTKVKLLQTSNFSKITDGIPPRLNILLESKVEDVISRQDSFKIDTSVVLENIK